MKSTRLILAVLLVVHMVLIGLLDSALPAPLDAPARAAATSTSTTTATTSATATPAPLPAFTLNLPIVLGGQAVLLPITPSGTPTATPSSTPTATPSSTPTATALSQSATPTLSPSATPSPADDPILVGAGDISSCSIGKVGDEATAKLLDMIPGTVFTAGDNAYPDGTIDQFNNCYGPTWGRHKARTLPAAGNHDYHVPKASGYFTYFGAAAGDPTKGYYSYDLGAWHIIVINSNCAFFDGCKSGSLQEQWLRADLAAHPADCTLAYWHHPRFSSGFHGNQSRTQPFWQALYEAGAEVVISAHSHSYERFAPQDSAGLADPQHGIREIVVGTGGDDLQPWGRLQPNSEVRDNTTHGVLKLTLHPTGYDWQFIPVAGQTFRDAGSGVCHPPPPQSQHVPQRFGAVTFVQSPLVCRLGSASEYWLNLDATARREYD
jgi:hypothetical protein